MSKAKCNSWNRKCFVGFNVQQWEKHFLPVDVKIYFQLCISRFKENVINCNILLEFKNIRNDLDTTNLGKPPAKTWLLRKKKSNELLGSKLGVNLNTLSILLERNPDKTLISVFFLDLSSFFESHCILFLLYLLMLPSKTK